MKRVFLVLSIAVIMICGRANVSFALPLEPAAQAFMSHAYRQVVELLPEGADRPEARLVRGRALLRLGRYAEAREDLANLEKALPILADLILYLRGEAELGAGDPAAAAKDFALAIAAQPSHRVDQARLRRAEALMQANRPSAAANEYAAFLQTRRQHPRAAEIELAMAEAELRAGRRREAARDFQRVWLEWPASPAALNARQLLDRLVAESPTVVAPPTAAQLMERALRLRRAKRYDEALAQLEAIEQSAPALRNKALYWRAYILRKSGHPETALPLFETLAGKVKGNTYDRVRRQRSECLAQTGRLEEALQLYADNLPSPGVKRINSVQRQALSETIGLLQRYGRYAEALAAYEQLDSHTRPRSQPDHERWLTWLYYRAGRYDEALIRLQRLAERRSLEPFSLYWQARAQSEAGRAYLAQPLYEDLVNRFGGTYYGQLARSRLVEAGRIPLEPGTCSSAREDRAGPEISTMVIDLAERWSHVLPDLHRVRLLWSLGMREEARRELYLVALDYVWGVYGPRRRMFRMRDAWLRFTYGGPVSVFSRSRWARWRSVRAHRQDIGPLLTRVLDAAGLSYFSWRLGTPDEDPLRQLYPRAYPEIVETAAERYDLDPSLIWAIMRTESAFRPDAISRVQAAGLMQLMPVTARRLAAEIRMQPFDPESVFDEETNVTLAGHYLSGLVEKFHGQIPLVAAAYNGGPHNVAEWLDARGKVSRTDEFIEEIPFRESRRYAQKIVRLLGLYQRLYCKNETFIVSNTLETSYRPHPNY